MQEYLEEIEDWMSQVRDEETSVEEYDFLDRLSHDKPEGSDGLANVGAYLAIYEEGDELKVDEELVEELDSRQGSSRRKRFKNIVHDPKTKKREGKTLKDREVDGHGRIKTMLEEFRENAEPRSRGDSHMTEDNEDNTYEKAIETLDTLGGYALAVASGPINVPATLVGVGADYLQGKSEEDSGNDTISSKPQTKPESYGGDNDMVTDDELEQAAEERTAAVSDVSEDLVDSGATADDAVDAADNAVSSYVGAQGDLREARETLKETYDEDSEIFGYAEKALEEIDRTLEDGVIDPLSRIDHDSYDLEDVKRELNAAGQIWDKRLPDDPDDITDY